uniref:Protein kinase domain-containing protein n=1 Tax=Trichobilharzia regenti TaxID=157069 RepID=A0AA85J7Y2_TRIRE|nr:unnamed protein product [Trichobilharzia regenti]
MVDGLSGKSVITVNAELLERILTEKHTLAVTSSADIYLGFWNDRRVIVKRFHENCLHLARKELSLIGQIEHENIIKLLAAGPALPQSCSFLVLEYAEYQSLQKVLYDFPEVDYNLLHVLIWILQISRASDYLHRLCSPPIVHADIKPSNILGFDKLRCVKLADFASSRTVQYNEPSVYGTLCYMAPELWTVRTGEDVPYSGKSDVYSLMITFWEFLARQPPYEVLKRRDVSDKFWSSITERPPLLDGCPELINSILQRFGVILTHIC